VFRDRVLESLVELAEAVLQNFGEPYQDREGDAAQLQFFDQFLKIDRSIGLFRGVNPQVAIRPDREVALAPTGDIVQLGRVGGGPSFGGFPNCGFRKFQ
jgi:hypothetical protein